MKFALLSAAFGLLSAISASPIAQKRDTQFGPCVTTLCPTLTGLTLSLSTPPLNVGGDLTCVYADVIHLLKGINCIFNSNGDLIPNLSASQCLGLNGQGICQSCADGYLLNAGKCILKEAPVTLTVIPTITNFVTIPATTIIPKITSTITGLATATVKVTVTLPNPIAPTTITKTITKVVTTAASTVTNAVTKTVTTGTPTKTQYELVFPTDCCPDAYLSLHAAPTSVGATAGVQKRDLSTVTVTALNTVTAVVTEKVGTLTGAAAIVKVTVPAAKVTVSATITGAPKTVTKTATVTSTVTAGVKTVTPIVTKSVANTGVYTSTITPPNVCPTAGLGVSVGGGLGGVVGTALSPIQQAVQSTLQGYSKLSAGLDVLVLCGTKLLAF